MRRWVSSWLVAAMLSTAQIAAQSPERDRWEARTSRARQNRVGWTAAGAAGGFGLGVYLGLRYFDDAINSDRKVWTTAIVGAIAGGVAGFLVGQARRHRAPEPAGPVVRPLPDRALAAPPLRLTNPEPAHPRPAGLFGVEAGAAATGDVAR